MCRRAVTVQPLPCLRALVCVGLGGRHGFVRAPAAIAGSAAPRAVPHRPFDLRADLLSRERSGPGRVGHVGSCGRALRHLVLGRCNERGADHDGGGRKRAAGCEDGISAHGEPRELLMDSRLHSRDRVLTRCGLEDDQLVIEVTRRLVENLPMKILVIEDEVRLAEYLRKGLSESGYVVDLAHDGIDGLHLAVEGTYDLIVLDVMLPGRDGFEVLAELRRQRRTPVLMLTARDAVEDKVKGLTGGADDYLVKPFSFSELSARVQALLRRGGGDREGQLPTSLRLADLEVDLARRKATRAGKRLELTPKEFNLLSLLLRRRGEVLSRTVMAEQVWDINFDSDTNVVEVAVRRLRAKLDEPFEVKLIHTVRGMGYVMEERQE
mmetsp:Transcript_61822/g.146358  ORF Transcript_61822/g.146358 Transcript_61822/m.146358 type:complete len:380 (+) Transcript_61822:3155-4294(+)